MSIWNAVDINTSIDSIKINKYIKNDQLALKLITDLLSIKENMATINNEFQSLERLVNNDFIQLVKKDDLNNEAEVFVKLSKAMEKVEEVIRFPFMFDKHIVAIGGGFSAGKSQFVNSILNEEILPTDTRPTTSIPTYITNGDFLGIYALNIFGNKCCIDKDGLQAISHIFSEKYNLSFTKLLKSIILHSNDFQFERIAFLDTPGYTKSDVLIKEDNTDENIAKEHLKLADYLIWVIDIENGTISNDDINFLKELGFQKPIFFVLNKADKKEISEVENIIEVTRNNLEKSAINVAGIAAYSSIEQCEFTDNLILDFIEEINSSEFNFDIEKEFQEVFIIYQKHFNNKIKNLRKNLGILNNCMLYIESDTEKRNLRKLINKIKKEIKGIKELKDEFLELENNFKTVLTKIFSVLDIHKKNLDSYLAKDSFIDRYINERHKYISQLLSSLEEELDDLINNLRLEEIIKEEIVEVINVRKEKEEINITKWYNPFTWGKTKEVLREVPIVSTKKVNVINRWEVLKFLKEIGHIYSSKIDVFLRGCKKNNIVLESYIMEIKSVNINTDYILEELYRFQFEYEEILSSKLEIDKGKFNKLLIGLVENIQEKTYSKESFVLIESLIKSVLLDINKDLISDINDTILNQ